MIKNSEFTTKTNRVIKMLQAGVLEHQKVFALLKTAEANFWAANKEMENCEIVIDYLEDLLNGPGSPVAPDIRVMLQTILTDELWALELADKRREYCETTWQAIDDTINRIEEPVWAIISY